MAFEAIRMDEDTKRHYIIRRKRGPRSRHCKPSTCKGQVKEKDCVGVAKELRGNPGAFRTVELRDRGAN